MLTNREETSHKCPLDLFNFVPDTGKMKLERRNAFISHKNRVFAEIKASKLFLALKNYTPEAVLWSAHHISWKIW